MKRGHFVRALFFETHMGILAHVSISKTICHSERSEESLYLLDAPGGAGIPRCGRNDNVRSSTVLLLRAYRIQTLFIKLQKLRRILFGLVGCPTALKTRAARGCCFSVSRAHRYKLHQIQCNVFITARCCSASRCFFHDAS